MTTDAERSLEQRLQRIEDYIAIQQLITSYGPAADSCAMDIIRDIWSEDGVYDARPLAYLKREQILEGFDHPFHQALVAAGSSHSSTMPHIVIDGDKASATHYASLYKHVDGEFRLLRLIASRWLLKRDGHGWSVYRRPNRLLDGTPDAPEMLGRVLLPPSDDDVPNDEDVDTGFGALPARA